MFARIARSGAVQPIVNRNLIYAGEKLVHVPTHYKSLSPSVIGSTSRNVLPPVPPLSEAEKKRIIVDSLHHDFSLRGDHLPFLDKLIDVVGYADNAASLGEIVGLVAEGTAVAGAASAVAVLNIFLTPIQAVIQWGNVLEAGEKLIGMRAVAYSTTAWAFGDGKPRFPNRIRENIAGFNPPEVARSEAAWNEASNSTFNNFEAEVRKGKISAINYKQALRAAGNNRKNDLTKSVMHQLEKSLSQLDKEIFWSPEPSYPE